MRSAACHVFLVLTALPGCSIRLIRYRLVETFHAATNTVADRFINHSCSGTVMWPTGESISQILARAGDGDSEATNQLLEQHREGLLRMVRARLDQRIIRRVDASDVVQDVLIEASRRLPDYLASQPVPFGTWIRQLARDQMIDMHRRHRGAAKRSVDREQTAVPSGLDASSIDLIHSAIDPELTPAAASMQREFQFQFEQALAKLPEEDREIILIRDVEQLGNAEAAELLGLSTAAAGMRHLRALRKLRQLLSNSDSE